MNKRAKLIKMINLFFAVDYLNKMSSILEKNSGFDGKDDDFICLYKLTKYVKYLTYLE